MADGRECSPENPDVYDARLRRLAAWRPAPGFQRRLLLRVQVGRCFYCREIVHRRRATLDHFIPQARGGNASLGNKVVACAACNHAKGNRLPTDEEVARHALLLFSLEAIL
jgi:5-methylcytosine-specific restriction endonuclease McrA